MSIYADNNKLVCSRILFELADAIVAAENNMLHIDDALIAAATPTVLLNFKAIEERDLKRIMVAMKRFFKHNPRYLDFTKSAVAYGLRQEWLPTLEDEDKVRLLSDFKLTPAVDENGYIVCNPNFLANVTKSSQHDDNNRYGKLDYVARPARKSATKRCKVLLTSVDPDADMATKIAPYLAWYKKYWAEIHPKENYKWEAVRHFQKYFDINAEDFAANIREAFSKAKNLLSGPMYFPLSMIQKHSIIAPDEVRSAFVSLYDETKPIYERSQNFIDEIAAIHNRHIEAGHFKPTDRDFQSERSNSVFLAFRYPDKHYLYKNSVWSDFKNEIGLDYPPLTHFPTKLFGYELIANQIREVLIADKELVALLKESQPDDISNGYLLTQDFMYAIAVHMLDLAEPPIKFE